MGEEWYSYRKKTEDKSIEWRAERLQ